MPGGDLELKFIENIDITTIFNDISCYHNLL